VAFDYITVQLVTVTTTTDKYGDSTETETSQDVEQCLFAPRTSTERDDPRQPAVITGGTLYMPYGAPVPGPNDYLVTPDGRKWAVDGEAGVWGTAGIEVALKRWEQPS